jgi:hypothetical protein
MSRRSTRIRYEPARLNQSSSRARSKKQSEDKENEEKAPIVKKTKELPGKVSNESNGLPSEKPQKRPREFADFSSSSSEEEGEVRTKGKAKKPKTAQPTPKKPKNQQTSYNISTPPPSYRQRKATKRKEGMANKNISNSPSALAREYVPTCTPSRPKGNVVSCTF